MPLNKNIGIIISQDFRKGTSELALLVSLYIDEVRFSGTRKESIFCTTLFFLLSNRG